MLREYLISEAMHGLGIPTTRSLAVVSTESKCIGDPFMRAVLTRIASSHIRGTFEYARAFEAKISTLMDYTIQRHYPQIIKQTIQLLNY